MARQIHKQYSTISLCTEKCKIIIIEGKVSRDWTQIITPHWLFPVFCRSISLVLAWQQKIFSNEAILESCKGNCHKRNSFVIFSKSEQAQPAYIEPFCRIAIVSHNWIPPAPDADNGSSFVLFDSNQTIAKKPGILAFHCSMPSACAHEANSRDISCRCIEPEVLRSELDPGSSQFTQTQKPNSWTYNFIEVSGHNLESSQTWGFCMVS